MNCPRCGSEKLVATHRYCQDCGAPHKLTARVKVAIKACLAYVASLRNKLGR